MVLSVSSQNPLPPKNQSSPLTRRLAPPFLSPKNLRSSGEPTPPRGDGIFTPSQVFPTGRQQHYYFPTSVKFAQTAPSRKQPVGIAAPISPNNSNFHTVSSLKFGQSQSVQQSGSVNNASKHGIFSTNISKINSAAPVVWHNDLKTLFHQNQAVIYALNIRTFGAQDLDGDGHIDPAKGESGTFLSAIPHLDELADMGVNTIHLLPISPVTHNERMGNAGSLYATSDYHALNPELGQLPTKPETPWETQARVQAEARQFVNACHQRGIRVMVDVPSCASADLEAARPDLILKDENGKPLTPNNWIDIAMFRNNQALQQYFEGYFDLMANRVGVDGFRVDVARARTLDFWRHFTQKYPEKAWLAESYCHEDQSPLKNLPRDTPEELLNAGFDSMYGQFHIFYSMNNAKEYMDYLLSSRAMFQRASTTDGNDKSFIGSYLTHDDHSLMTHGGTTMSILASGLMTTQPWTNPYILDGFTTGYTGDCDIFNYTTRPTGEHPEIGAFLQHMLAIRKQYGPVLSQGAFIPIPIQGNPTNNQVIAYARQAEGKTLLVIANKDVNARHQATLNIPGLSSPMQNLLPKPFGEPSYFSPKDDQVSVDLGPGRFHIFEINTPNLARDLVAY